MQVSQKLKWGGDGAGDVVRFPEILAPIPLRSGSIPGSQLIPGRPFRFRIMISCILG
jgi:hypothetical protein